MTSHYRHGADLERTVRQFRIDAGALYTIRSAGSRGLVDILAIFPEKLELIQCKKDATISLADRTALVDLATTLTEATGMKHVPYLAYKRTGIVMMMLEGLEPPFQEPGGGKRPHRQPEGQPQ